MGLLLQPSQQGYKAWTQNSFGLNKCFLIFLHSIMSWQTKTLILAGNDQLDLIYLSEENVPGIITFNLYTTYSTFHCMSTASLQAEEPYRINGIKDIMLFLKCSSDLVSHVIVSIIMINVRLLFCSKHIQLLRLCLKVKPYVWCTVLGWGLGCLRLWRYLT